MYIQYLPDGLDRGKLEFDFQMRDALDDAPRTANDGRKKEKLEILLVLIIGQHLREW